MFKKVIICAAITSTSLCAGGPSVSKIATIDSIALFQKSKEGKALVSAMDKDKETAVTKLRELEKEITTLRGTLEKQASLLDKDSLNKKQLELAQKEKKFVRERDEALEDLEMKFRSKQEVLFNKQVQLVKNDYKKRGGGVLIDVRAPGVIVVDESLDMTNDFLKVVDADFDSSKIPGLKKA